MISRVHTLELPPRLAVGVRSADDLEAAVRGGAEIIELSIGAHGWEDLIDQAAVRAPQLGICLDLGELADWKGTPTSTSIPAHARWVKLGFASGGADPDWMQAWRQLRTEIEAASGRSLKWLAAAYADHVAAGSPKVGEILSVAVEESCAGLMIQTSKMSGDSIADWMSACELSQVAWLARELRMPLFLAAGAVAGDLDWLCDLEPAAVVVHGSVCLDDAGLQVVDAARVARFKAALDAASGFDRDAWTSKQCGRDRRAVCDRTAVSTAAY